MKINKKYTIYVIIAIQLSFLVSMIWFHAAKLRSSEKIMLKTLPVDPMSMFRGRYARLRYEIGNVPSSMLKDVKPDELNDGDILFVAMVPEGDHWAADGVYRNRNNCHANVFLRGRLNRHYLRGPAKTIYLEYGIESFFLNEKAADEVDGVNTRQQIDWKEVERRRQERLASLDEETRRIKKAGISKWWYKTLKPEVGVWVDEGIVDEKAKEAIQNKYDTALEKLEEVNREVNPILQREQRSVMVEVAVDRQGNGYPVRLFMDGKEYK